MNFSPFHMPWIQSESPPYPPPTWIGTGSFDSTSNRTGVPSGVVPSMVAPVGIRVPERVVDLDPRPAQLLDAAVLPDPGAVVQRPEAAGLLLDDEDDREVVERHRHVQPPHALERRIRRPPSGFGFADGPDAPRPVARPDPYRRVDGDLLAVDDDVPTPRAHLREPLRVQRDPGTRPQHVPLLLDDVEQPIPRQVDGHALGLVHDDAQLVQRVGDLDAVAADVLVEPVLVDRVGQVYGGLLVAPRRTSTNASLTPRLG